MFKVKERGSEPVLFPFLLSLWGAEKGNLPTRLEFRFEINGGIGASDLDDYSQTGTCGLHHQCYSGNNHILVGESGIFLRKDQFQGKGCI